MLQCSNLHYITETGQSRIKSFSQIYLPQRDAGQYGLQENKEH